MATIWMIVETTRMIVDASRDTQIAPLDQRTNVEKIGVTVVIGSRLSNAPAIGNAMSQAR